MSAQPEPVAAEVPPDPIARLAWLFGRTREQNGLPPGELAELRRMDPRGVLPPACWRLLATLDARGTEQERAWALVIRTMLDARLDAGGTSARPIGAVLADPDPVDRRASGYAEQRFVRLLRARGLAEITHEARQAARWCAVHAAHPRFTDTRGRDGFGRFILAAALGHQDTEARAHAIARDFFATQRRASKAQED
jgi:hypothetical protein